MNKNVKELVKYLNDEINWIDELNSVLSEEKVVLATRQFDQLEDLADKKQALTNQLEDSAARRVQLLAGAPSASDAKSALSEFLSQCTPTEVNEINQLNNKLAEKLAYCRELNTVNGQVIASNIHTRQEIVNALMGNKADAVSVYTATGDISSTSDIGHHQEA